MANKYSQLADNTNVHFSNALFGEVERSKMTATPIHLTTFNAGRLVPIYCREVLPNQNISIHLDFVLRQTTVQKPTMGSMKADIYAFFVPNRIVNQSWKAVQGENLSGSWTANNVTLATLVDPSENVASYKVPVGSIADYYGFPTQGSLPKSVLTQCHDLKFRGYVSIWNEWFRDQNYQPPIAMSTLNVNQSFFGSFSSVYTVDRNKPSDGSVGAGSIGNALFGSASTPKALNVTTPVANNNSTFGLALEQPLKVNKLHDYFTSVLPSPQKSNSSVFAPVSGTISSVPVVTSASTANNYNGNPLRWGSGLIGSVPGGQLAVTSSGSTVMTGSASSGNLEVAPSNLVTADGATVEGLALSVDDIRMASAIQQVYETLARGGSRYRELVQSFFGIEADDPYSDIPKCIGHISKELDLYQTAQTSSSESGGTPQGNLAGFGYTNFGADFVPNFKFLEHGYIHVFCVVRHRNIYPSYLAPDNFRLSMLDYYTPPLANISEQPVYARSINPFAPNPNNAFGYQEAWAEYRFEPDMVSGYMRPGVPESLAVWNYADNYDSSLQICNDEWLKSNSQEVLDRTLTATSEIAPQILGSFKFTVVKELPMPTYSVPGMDII